MILYSIFIFFFLEMIITIFIFLSFNALGKNTYFLKQYLKKKIFFFLFNKTKLKSK